MAVIINGDTGIDKITDGSVVNADIASGIDAAKLIGTLPALDASSLTGIPQPAALTTASGSAPSYSARAWVNFKGTGTVSIRGSGNVSSITDLGSVGQYRVNFTTAMPDTNYAVLATHSNYNGTNAIGAGDYTLTPACDAAATTYCNVASGDNDSNVYLDCLNLNVAVFR